MSETAASRGSSWHEAPCSQGGGGGGGGGSQQASSGGLELHRRLFSCCNVALQEEACLVDGHERIMLMEQPMFTEHALMKGIKASVSEQRYKDANGFIDDFTRLLDTCVVECDRGPVLDALKDHVIKTGQPDFKRPSKATFHGFPHPLLEEMLAQTAMARKKMSPSGMHATVDVGRYLARAYGKGLTSGAKFIGKPSREKSFHAQRKEREVEWTNVANAEEAEALKANKKVKAKGKGVDVPKKRQKTSSPVSVPSATPRPNRSLRTTRRMISEDSGDELPRSDTPVAAGKVTDTATRGSDSWNSSPSGEPTPHRLKPRDRVHCHHLQGQVLEMYDEDYRGRKKQGILDGQAIICLCGCGITMKGGHWLEHNGGRSSNRHPGYPWKYMRIVETKEMLANHRSVCDTHPNLCDSCLLWESPGLPMTTCWKCHTSVHASEDCAMRESSNGVKTAAELVAPPPSAKKSRTRPGRNKEPRAVEDKSTVWNGGGSIKREDPNAGAWVCQICAGYRTVRQRASFNKKKPQNK
ncbi:unnamed protein product [Ectocarpus sp. 4 AP-2014]